MRAPDLDGDGVCYCSLMKCKQTTCERVPGRAGTVSRCAWCRRYEVESAE